MAHVAHDADLQVADAALVLADGIQVEQRLGRMLMLAVTRVDHDGRRVLRNDVRSPRMLVAHDDRIDLVGVQRLDGVYEAFALDRRGGRPAEVQRIGRKALFGELERAAGARGRLVEHVHDREPPKRGNFLDLAVVDRGERFRGIEDEGDVLFGVFPDIDQMPVVECHATRLPEGRSRHVRQVGCP